MAHRTNVIQVSQNFDSPDSEVVVDPICKKKMESKDCKHMLFQENRTYYFCSKACKMKLADQLIRGEIAA